MKVPVYNMEGEKQEAVELPEGLFGLPMNRDLLYQAVRVYRSHMQRPRAHTKGRSEVRGGGRKPWRQKGTGRARHGSIRSPLWRGGGVTFGPRKERNPSLVLPKKMRKKACAVALSAKARDGEVIVLDALSFSEPKTKQGAALLEALREKAIEKENNEGARPTFVVSPSEPSGDIARVFRNIPEVRYVPASRLNVYDVLSAKYFVLTKDALSALEKRLGPTSD